jgi:hypothetical protein
LPTNDWILKSNSDFVLAPLDPAAARVLQLAQQPAEGINLMFVGKFLPFGVFDQFQNLLHLFQRLLQGLNNLGHFADRLADGGSRRSGLGRARGFLCGRERFFGRRAEGLFRRHGRHGWTGAVRAASATAATTPAPSAALTSGLGGAIGLGCWFRLGHAGWQHDAPPDKSNGELFPTAIFREGYGCFFTNKASEAVYP